MCKYTNIYECAWASACVTIPIRHLPHSVVNRQQRIDNVTSKLTGASTLWEMWSRDEQKHFLVDVLAKLGLRGVLDLLGVRQTVGSADLLPSSRETLLSTFNALHRYVLRIAFI